MNINNPIMPLVKSGISLIWVETSEEERFTRMCLGQTWKIKTPNGETETGTYTVLQVDALGTINQVNIEVDSEDGTERLKYASVAQGGYQNAFVEMQKPDRRFTLLLCFEAEMQFMNQPPGIRLLKNTKKAMESIGSAIVFVTPILKLPPQLEHGWFSHIELPLPEAEELEGPLNDIVSSRPDIPCPPEIRKRMLDAAKGLTFNQAKDQFALSLVKTGKHDPEVVVEAKMDTVRRSGLLEIHKPVPIEHLGGLSMWKDFVDEEIIPAVGTKRAVRRVLLIGQPGCLHGNTPIYDPVNETTKSVAQRHLEGMPFHVWAMSSDGPVVTLALPPHRYKKESMLEFTFEDGNTIITTPGHRFLVQFHGEDGQKYLSAAVVYGQIQQSGSFPLQTIGGIGLPIRDGGGPHLLGTPQDLTDGYSLDLRAFGDAQLLLASDSDQALPPSLVGVQPHIPDWCSKDGLDDISTHILFSSPDHPSKQGYVSHPSFDEMGPREPSIRHLPAKRLYQELQLLPPGSSQIDTTLPPSIVVPLSTSQLQCTVVASQTSTSKYTNVRYTRICSARQVGEHPYYDFHVPGYENYWAMGVFHHNCGKSLSSKVLSSKLKWPLLLAPFSQWKEGTVGSSERNTANGLALLKATAPGVAWFDEIDDSMGGHESSSKTGDTTGPMVGIFATWLEEKQPNNVIVVCTANNPDKIPMKIMRRFDEVWFVDLPTDLERPEIAAIHFKLNAVDPTPEICKLVGDLSRGWTGDEIRKAIVSAVRRAKDGPVTQSLLEAAASTMKPLSVLKAEEIAALREWGYNRARIANTPDVVAAAPKATRKLQTVV